MGRGAGNLPIETLITYFEKSIDRKKYNVLPILELIDKYFLDLSKKYKWGYNLPYMISGIYEAHPNYATYLIDSGKYNLQNIQFALQLINKINPVGFNKELIVSMENKGFISNKNKLTRIDNPKNKFNIGSGFKNLKATYKDRHNGRDFLILANGASLAASKKEIKKFIKQYSPIIIGSNYLAGLFVPHYHSFNNKDRFRQFIGNVNPKSELLLSTVFEKKFVKEYTKREFEIIACSNLDNQFFSIKNEVIVNDCKSISVLSIAVAIVMGAKRIFVAGMDGYKDLDTFIDTDSSTKRMLKNDYSNFIDISSRGGEYHIQMEWHDLIDKLLRMINQYLLSVNKNELLIITPTTHRFFYKDIRSFLSENKNA
jgi:4-hydroxy 2-oxovalerate aldolase